MSTLRIWKFPLSTAYRQFVVMPAGAELLTVQMQNQGPQLWAVCDTAKPSVPRQLGIYGTGNPLPKSPGRYIATFQIHGGELVFHAFDHGEMQ